MIRHFMLLDTIVIGCSGVLYNLRVEYGFLIVTLLI